MKIMLSDYTIEDILADIAAIKDSFSLELFNKKYFGTIFEMLPTTFNTTIDIFKKHLTPENIAHLAIELNYRWSKVHLMDKYDIHLGDTSSSYEALFVNSPRNMTRTELQLKALQQLNIFIFTAFNDSLWIKRQIVSQFCLAAITSNNFGEHTEYARSLYSSINSYERHQKSKNTNKPSIEKLWSELKTWQKFAIMLSIMTLLALTILSAISGIGLIAEAFGVAVFGSAFMGWLGISSISAGVFGGISLGSALASGIVAKRVMQNPHSMFPSSCLSITPRISHKIDIPRPPHSTQNNSLISEYTSDSDSKLSTVTI